MRILLIAPQPFFIERGTPIAVRYLAEALCDAGHKVDLLTTHLGEDIDYPGLTVHRARAARFVKKLPIGFSIGKLLVDGAIAGETIRLLRKRSYDVVHAVEEAIFIALATRPISKAKLVYDMDSLLSDQLIEKYPRISWLGRSLQALERKAVCASDLVLPVCDAIAQRARTWTDGPIHVLPDIAPEPASGTSMVSSIRSESERPLALYVGNLDHYQGIDLLLEAVSHIEPEARPDLAIIGGSDEAIAGYSQMADQLGLGTDVRFLGPRPLSELMDYLGQADILCSPRIKGVNTPMKVYAYMASGKPIVATDILSHTQVLDADSAFLAAAEPEAYARALRNAVGDPARRLALGTRAASVAKHSYGIERYRQRLSDAYAELSGMTVKDGKSATNSHD